MIRVIEKSNPDHKRFRVNTGRKGSLAEIRDMATGLTYSLYRSEDIRSGRGWSILPQDGQSPQTWDWEDFNEMLEDLWDEIKWDAEHS